MEHIELALSNGVVQFSEGDQWICQLGYQSYAETEGSWSIGR